MRFPTAWADIATQNVTLKFVIGALSISLITTATIAAKLGLKDPIVVERGCVSKSANTVPAAIQLSDRAKGSLPVASPVKGSRDRNG